MTSTRRATRRAPTRTRPTRRRPGRRKWHPVRALRKHLARTRKAKAAKTQTGVGLASVIASEVNVRLATWRKDPDAAAQIDRSTRLRRRWQDRRGTFVCGAHRPPQQFASTADLNEHLLSGHPEPVAHPRGQTSKPVRTIPSRPPRGPRGTNTKTGDHWLRLYLDQIRDKAVTDMAWTQASQLGDIGSVPVRSVMQIREVAAAMEAIALQFQEAVEGFQQNARTSEQAPIVEEVLSALNPAKDGAEQAAKSAVAFLAAFEDYYGDDIRDAQAGERMDNEALKT